jgi:hypothetical protein
VKPISSILVFFWLSGGVFAEPSIVNGSFEAAKNLAPGVTTEQLLRDPSLLARIMTPWCSVAWGTKEATPKALTLVEMPGSPDGKFVAQIDNRANQISVFAYELPQKDLHAGMWYEVSVKIRTENLIGQGAFLNAEFWRGGCGSGSVDSEHLIGTNPWREAKVRFIAPPHKYQTKLSLWAFGGPGKAWFDDARIHAVDPPKADPRGLGLPHAGGGVRSRTRHPMQSSKRSKSTRSRPAEEESLSALRAGIRCSGRARPLRGLAGRSPHHLRIRDPWSRQMGPPQANAIWHRQLPHWTGTASTVTLFCFALRPWCWSTS